MLGLGEKCIQQFLKKKRFNDVEVFKPNPIKGLVKDYFKAKSIDKDIDQIKVLEEFLNESTLYIQDHN